MKKIYIIVKNNKEELIKSDKMIFILSMCRKWQQMDKYNTYNVKIEKVEE